MRTLQFLRLISILAAMIVGAWLPIRLVQLGEEIGARYDAYFDLMVSFASMINIYLHFRESKESPREWRAWLEITVFLDLLCVIPLSYVSLWLLGSKTSALLLINLLTVRHIRRLKDFLDSLNSLHPVAYRTLPLLLQLPLLVHLIAYGWIALGSGNTGPVEDHVLEYVRAVYWSISTLTSVGYGDIIARSQSQMLYSSLVQIIGIALFGYIVSNVASVLTRLDAARERHMERLDRVESFMRTNQIPWELRSKTRDYFKYLWVNHKGTRDQSLLETLPKKIQAELIFHINRAMIEKVPYLKGASQELIEDLMSQVEPTICAPGEKIFRTGETGNALYFIRSGEVEIINRDGQHVAFLKDGAFFGEGALLSDRPRNMTARASTFCDLYVLPKDAFKRVLDDHPEFRKHVESVAKQRQA